MPKVAAMFVTGRVRRADPEFAEDAAVLAVSRSSQTMWTVAGRLLIYGSPFVAGAFTGGYAALLEKYAPVGPFPSGTSVGFVNAALAAIGSAAGVPLLTGRLSVRVAGSIAYGVLSLFLYGCSASLFYYIVHHIVRSFP
jgi:hypothetical protein